MIRFEHTEVVGWEHAIRGMRNPMNSWERSDSEVSVCECEQWPHDIKKSFVCLGPNDHDLMMRLANGGPVHAKYRRMITVYVDITAPLYWWKEMDTYQVGVVKNSCSTMHKIAAKEFTLEDFSCEHLMGYGDIREELLNREDLSNLGDACCIYSENECDIDTPQDIFCFTISMLNRARELYLKTKTKPMKSEEARKELLKKYWWQMIQLLPTSYNQKRTVMLNYEVLNNIYHSRKDHKLDEWREFCKWIEGLPYSEIITGKECEV